MLKRIRLTTRFGALRCLMAAALTLTALSQVARAEIDLFGGFQSAWRLAWTERIFAARSTNYEVVSDEHGRPALRADSRSASSGLVRPVRGLAPMGSALRWRWKVEIPLENQFVEAARAGDDYAARVWVIFEQSWWPLRSRAICYVWADRELAGKSYPNPFTPHMAVVVLRSGRTEVGHWREENRDLAADYQRCFGEMPQRLDAVGVMTDTDNTGHEATSWFADLRLTSGPAPTTFRSH